MVGLCQVTTDREYATILIYLIDQAILTMYLGGKGLLPSVHLDEFDAI